MTELALRGLDGANSLAFLTALGALRITSERWREDNASMYWLPADSGWQPCVTVKSDITIIDWIAGLNDSLREMIKHPALSLADDLTLSCADFRDAALVARDKSSSTNRSQTDFLAAFGSEAIESEQNGKKTGRISDTALRTMSGAGHQHLLGFMRALVEITRTDDLHSALFCNWSYTDPGPSLRWDPIDDRRYALRWREPSGDAVKTVRGANRLAIEALPLLPTMPMQGRLQTTAFTQRKGKGVFWTWPIWSAPATLDIVRSLLSLSELQQEDPDRYELNAVGVTEIYRCQRITQGKYRNFTPARPA